MYELSYFQVVDGNALYRPVDNDFKIMFTLMKPFLLNPTKGAEVSLYLASSPDVANVSGKSELEEAA